jgi:beta-mannosidase
LSVEEPLAWLALERWQVACSPPGACADPAHTDSLSWIEARVPGTVAAALDAKQWRERDLDAEDWWFATSFDAPDSSPGERLVLELDGIATIAEVYLNGSLLLRSRSMFKRHTVDVTELLGPRNELAIVCRALSPLLSARRRPVARWRTRVVNHSGLRWQRTMIFGRSPGFAPGPAAVGPWRPVRLVRRLSDGLDALQLRATLDGDDGVIVARARPRGNPGGLRLCAAGRTSALRPGADGWLEGQLRLGRVQRWWPHTHGEPALHELAVRAGERTLARRRVGFRTLRFASRIEEDGLDLHVNGARVFARGAVWTPADLVSLAPGDEQLRRLLVRARDAGMNMLRIPGTGCYESPLFHDLCDELGILLWQDLMFANLDYPLQDEEFLATVLEEARELIELIGWRPSLAVLCGNSEVEQQPAMLGLDPALGRHRLWEETLPALVAEQGLDCAYVRSTPCGGALPFHADRGISHYFGVSGYFRPLEDARRAGVRFAAECLAIANVPDEVHLPVHHPQWKAGVVRDAGTGWGVGAGWDFDDVRDHYLRLLFGVDPVALRRFDHERYLELSRAVSGEVMAETIGEWRRCRSTCSGALVLWLKDMLPGAGLGVLDHNGAPKVAYHHLRRAMAPVAVWMTDEGVNGIAVHLANDRCSPLRLKLRLALYGELETLVAQVEETVLLEAHRTQQRNLEGMLGRFVDGAWAYRFGPPAGDLIVASLTSCEQPERLISQAFRFTAGRPLARESAASLGLSCEARAPADGELELRLTCTRLTWGVRVQIAGFEGEDDAFCLEPGHERLLRLRSRDGAPPPAAGWLSALNLRERLAITVAG